MRVSQRLTLGLAQKCPEGKSALSQRWTLGLSENAPRANPATSQRLPPLSPLSPINIVHPSKGRRGSYLKVICRYLSCGPYAQGNPEGGLEGVWRGSQNPDSGKCNTHEVCLEVVRNHSMCFSTAPRSAQPCPNGGFPFGHPEVRLEGVTKSQSGKM